MNEEDDAQDLTDRDLTEGLDLGFEGAEDIVRAWRRGMRPDPDLTVSEWADQHRCLSSRASAEPGRYRTTRTPYLRAIMDALLPNHLCVWCDKSPLHRGRNERARHPDTPRRAVDMSQKS